MKQTFLLMCTLLFSVQLLETSLFAQKTLRITQTCVDETIITVNPATMKLVVGEQSPRLAYTVAPIGTKVQISWTSDNEEVATVNAQGVVTGINNGTTHITCTDALSGAKGTCVVTVASKVENLEFTEAYIGYKTIKDPISGQNIPDIDSTIVKYYNKTLCEQLGVDSLNAYTAMMRVQIFSGLYFNAGGALDGAEVGAYIIGYSPAFLLPKELNRGLATSTVISLGTFSVDMESEPTRTKQHHMEIGKLNNDTLMKYMPLFFADYNANKQMTQKGYNYLASAQIYGTTGTTLRMVGYDAEEISYAAYPNWLWKYMPNAIITGGDFYIGGTQGSSEYMYQLDYINLSAREVLTDEFGVPGVFTDMPDPTQFNKMKSTGWELGQEFKYEAGQKPKELPRKIINGIPMTELAHPIPMPSIEEDRKIQEMFEKCLSNKKDNISRVLKTRNNTYTITVNTDICDNRSVTAEQDEQVTIFAIPDKTNNGVFVRWSDGNTDNPRIIIAQSDITLTAHFAYKCGDNLFGVFDAKTGELQINGSGTMYDFSHSTVPWNDIKNLITKVTIQDGVTSIGDEAFAYCGGLTSVTIPNSVTTIGKSAFYNCSGLTSVTIPNSVTSIEEGAFTLCSSLTSINVDAANTHYTSIDGILFNYAKDTLIQYPIGNTRTLYAIPNSVKTIGYIAFEFCSSLTSVTIPNSVKTIGTGAFAHCSSLISVTISNSVTTIGDYAFYNCTGLTSVTIPNSVTTIGEDAFNNCSGLTSVTIGNSVTTIGHEAFYNCSGLTSVTIPNSVTTIGDLAFYNCTGLTSPVYNNNIFAFMPISYTGAYMISDGITQIAGGAFYGCSGLTSVTIGNSVTTIGYEAFYGCSGLTSVTIPNSVTTIGDYAFYRCESIKIVFNGSGLNITKGSTNNGYIAYYADIVYNWMQVGDFRIRQDTLVKFVGEISNVSIPNGIKTISKSAFANCSTLTSVVIANSVETISDSAFANCTYLIDIVIGANVTEIGCNAFAGDIRIEKITCYAPVTPNVCNTTFGNLDKSVIYLYVPADYQRKYQVDPNWKNFDLHLIGAEQTQTDNKVTVTPSATEATFVWPSNDQADSYSLEITKDGVVFCTLKFNAQGQLTGIAFAPSRGEAHTMPAATMTTNGWQFTVTGLNQASKYAYTMDVTDASQKSIKTYTGEFATDGYTDLEGLTIDNAQCTVQKMIIDNQLFIRRGNELYNAMGQKVR